jgi:hypothetical protein
VTTAPAAIPEAAGGELVSAVAPAPPPSPRWPALSGLGLIVIACILLVTEHQPSRAEAAEERML